MPAFCQHTRKPLKPLEDVYPAFHGLEKAEDFAVSENGIIYYLKARSLDYGPDYFLSEYEAQYGKSYLDDEPNLRRLSASRLDWMDQTLVVSGAKVDWPEQGPALLEIGSAAGFFLDEANDRGYRTLGVEISDFASNFARGRGHSIFAGSFSSADLSGFLAAALGNGKVGKPEPNHWETQALEANRSETKDSPTTDRRGKMEVENASQPGEGDAPSHNGQAALDLIAAFYTLEHFPDQQFAFKRLARLLKPGGLLLLSIPSYHGPLFRCSPQTWLSSHPEDHFADYSPDSLALTLELYGLKQIAVRPASFHRKRACGWIRYLGDGFYKKWALKHEFGDTMEVLARKELPGH